MKDVKKWLKENETLPKYFNEMKFSTTVQSYGVITLKRGIYTSYIKVIKTPEGWYIVDSSNSENMSLWKTLSSENILQITLNELVEYYIKSERDTNINARLSRLVIKETLTESEKKEIKNLINKL